VNKKYIVRLTDQEQSELAAVIKKLKGTGQKVRRAQVLFKADVDGPNWTDQRIAEAFGCRTKTVENIRQRLVERGFRETLDGGKRETPPVEKLLSGDQEARIIATRLGSPPPGYANWTLRLLARKVMELGIAESVSYETVRRMLKKNGMTNRKIEYWVIPPEADGEFVAHMEEVLETYEKPYNPACPVLCMDEQPVQLLKETRTPIPATADHGKRVDYEYERAGTTNIFMFTEPLAGWREVAVRETRTKVDWAIEMARLLEGRYADATRVILVCDNLNTHTKGAFYESFEPAQARQLVRRIEFCHTPKHGSWLNIAENELSSLTRQCVAGRRFGDSQTLRAETTAWSSDVNDTQRGVDWQMKIDDARYKLKSIYPKIKL
jgi:hypothetical protein